MVVGSNNSLQTFKGRLDDIVSGYQRPGERRIGYGNLRHEYSEYAKEGKNTVNIAVIYETPGGSTTQINISFDGTSGEYIYLDRDLESHITSRDCDEVIAAIEQVVTEIPGKRSAQLINQINAWMEMGKGRHEIFGELNKLLQTEFLGGRITTHELKEGIQHVVKQYAQDSA